MFGLKINFHKSELFLFGEAANKKEEYARIFTCPIGTLPPKYLGLPVDEKRNRNKHWKPPEEWMEKKCSNWQGRLVTIPGRLTLIQSSLTGIPNFMMYFYGLPMEVNKKNGFLYSQTALARRCEQEKIPPSEMG